MKGMECESGKVMNIAMEANIDKGKAMKFMGFS